MIKLFKTMIAFKTSNKTAQICGLVSKEIFKLHWPSFEGWWTTSPSLHLLVINGFSFTWASSCAFLFNVISSNSLSFFISKSFLLNYNNFLLNFKTFIGVPSKVPVRVVLACLIAYILIVDYYYREKTEAETFMMISLNLITLKLVMIHL